MEGSGESCPSLPAAGAAEPEGPLEGVAGVGERGGEEQGLLRERSDNWTSPEQENTAYVSYLKILVLHLVPLLQKINVWWFMW